MSPASPRVALMAVFLIAIGLAGCDTSQRSEVERLQAELCAGRRLTATVQELRLASACEARTKGDDQTRCRATAVYTTPPAVEGAPDDCAAERVYSHCKLHCEAITPVAVPAAAG